MTKWLSVGFVVVAGLHVTGLYMGRELLPFGGALAIGMLLAVAARSPAAVGGRPLSRRLALLGLALLAVTTAVAEGNSHQPPALVWSCLVAVAAIVLAAAVLAAVRRLRPRQYLPAVAFSVLFTCSALYIALNPRTGLRQIPPDLTLRTAVLLVPVTAVIMVTFAVNVGLAARGLPRRAGAALLPVLVMAIGAFAALSDNDLISSRPDPARSRPLEFRSDPARTPSTDALIARLETRYTDQSGRVEMTLTAPANAAPQLPVRVAEEGDWQPHPWPAYRAEILLLGLVALVTSLFRTEEEDAGPLR